jgi:hypothetical protein
VLATVAIISGDWASHRLPCAFGFTNADLLFCDDFHDPTRGWALVDATRGTADYRNGGLELRGKSGYALWDPAPTDIGAADIRITARAHFSAAGAGAWGVWCRGTDNARYEFTVTQAGAAYIKIGDHADLYQVPGFQADEPTTIEAICRDLPGGNDVELIMHVNGEALTVRRTAEGKDVLGPGRIGIHSVTFGDVPTAEPTVHFSLFLVERDHGN